jgi:2-polyprenyl-6-methoxyphenol hydroxylase-like FAD-dependent oxidoreductase
MSGRALIIGGSVGGLFAATLLRTIGWETLVFERTNGNLADRGTGIGTRDEMFAVMRRSGIAVHASIGIAVGSRICLDCDGTIAHELPITVTSSWARIYRRLRDARRRELSRHAARAPRAGRGRRHRRFADRLRVRGDL